MASTEDPPTNDDSDIDDDMTDPNDPDLARPIPLTREVITNLAYSQFDTIFERLKTEYLSGVDGDDHGRINALRDVLSQFAQRQAVNTLRTPAQYEVMLRSALDQAVTTFEASTRNLPR